jgi:hypothetical protein
MVTERIGRLSVLGVNATLQPAINDNNSADAMFNLFRRKPRRPPSRSSLQQSSPPRVELGRSDPPTLDGYTIREVDADQFAHSIEAAHLTPEQLRRWESALANKKN